MQQLNSSTFSFPDLENSVSIVVLDTAICFIPMLFEPTVAYCIYAFRKMSQFYIMKGYLDSGPTDALM